MDKEDLNLDTPIGQIIKRINNLCKKPQIDEQLESALEAFRDRIQEQQKYLSNGIFKTNFAEAALFIQSCAELYGKKIDLLWDEILVFHTRLIEYDCEHERQKGAKVNQEAIDRLEERRNRYKRKKKFKLILKQDDNVTDFLFDKPIEKPKTSQVFDTDDDLHRVWRRYEYRSEQMRKIPFIIYKQQRKMYRMKNYKILDGQDFDILDEDGEFITKYSRIPGWHHLHHLFEYNKEGLLPDKNNRIATLRLSMYLRLWFLRDNGFSLTAPYSEYKDQYLVFKQKFFEEESKKWQNMPLDTLEDLHKQLMFLAQMEKEREDALNNNIIQNMRMTPVPKLMNKDEIIYCSSDESNISLEEQGGGDPLAKMIDESDEDSLFELSFECESNLFVRLEKLSSDIIDNKLRQDSGFFDGNDEGDGENAGNDTGEEQSSAMDVVTAECGNPPEADAAAAKEADAAVADVTAENPLSQDSNADNLPAAAEITSPNSADPLNPPILEAIEPLEVNCDDNFDTRSIMSDHDYCVTPLPLAVDNRAEQNNQKVGGANEQEMVPFIGGCRIIPKAVKFKVPKEKPVRAIDKDGSALPKRRRLSQKQMEKLLRSLIPPMKEGKFEKFFSQNYQPQLGEGETQNVDYESDESEENEPETVPVLPDGNAISRNIDDDAQTVYSEHSYCQPPEDDLTDELMDSGFHDTSAILPPDTDNNQPEGEQNNSQAETSESQPESRRDDITQDAEYLRLMAALKESRQEMSQETVITPGATLSERQKMEQERQEARARVESWRETITPVLRKLRERDFDIHEYGSKIMDGMQVNETRPFKKIVEGLSSAEVVRFFISSLQLANTNNIEVLGAQPGSLSNDSYEVKLLTKDRYHEHLTEYEAPSKETFRERIRRMREKDRNRISDSSDEEPLSAFISPSKRSRTVASMSPTTTSGDEEPLSTFVSPPKRPRGSQNVASADAPIEALTPVQELRVPCVAEEQQPQSLQCFTPKTYKSTISNPTKGKSIVKRLVVNLAQEPSTSTGIHDFSIDSGLAMDSEDDGLDDRRPPVYSYEQMSPPGEVLTERRFRENLGGYECQSTPAKQPA